MVTIPQPSSSTATNTTSPSTKIPILLYGLGAIGSFYAWTLSKHPSIALTVCARSNYDAVSTSGLTIDSAIHGTHHLPPERFERVVRSPSELVASESQAPSSQPTSDTSDSGLLPTRKPMFAYIILTLKAISLPQIASSLTPLCPNSGTGVTFVIIQNGVGNELPFSSAFPNASILSCVTWVGATQTASGVVKHINAEGTQIGLFKSERVDGNETLDRETNSRTLEKEGKSRLEEFVGLLEDAGARGVEVCTTEGIQVKRWEKVAWNACWNGITALTGLDCGEWLGQRGEQGNHSEQRALEGSEESAQEADRLSRRIMREVINVARAIGVPIGDDASAGEAADPDEGTNPGEDVVNRHMEKMYSLGPVQTSMYHDRMAGRPMELEVILGHVVREGRRVGVDVGTVETLWVLLRRVDDLNRSKNRG